MWIKWSIEKDRRRSGEFGREEFVLLGVLGVEVRETSLTDEVEEELE